MSRSQSNILVIALGFTTFILLGLPSGILGVAWTSIQQDFSISLDKLGILLLAGTMSYSLSSFFSGQIISRLGIALSLILANLIFGLGLLLFAASPQWWLLVVLNFITSIGGGLIDAGLNLYFAHNFKASIMNWLHACFGVGATLGPILTSTLIESDISWRWSYRITAFLVLILVVLLWLTLKFWKTPPTAENPQAVQATDQRARTADTLRIAYVWMNLFIFLLYTGTEITAGQWSYSLFIDRNVPPLAASMWVSIYWGSFTAGRFLIGAIIDWLGSVRMLRYGLIGSMLGCTLMSLPWNPWFGFIGIALLGFSLAPVFPTIISMTPKLIGTQHANNAIGFQVAMAGIGYAVLPGAVGVLARGVGLEVLGPFMLIATFLMYLLQELSFRRLKSGFTANN